MATETKKKDIFIPKGYTNDDPNYFVSINGKNFLLPKGKKSSVPEYVYDEIMRSMNAAEKQDNRSEELQEKSKEPVYTV